MKHKTMIAQPMTFALCVIYAALLIVYPAFSQVPKLINSGAQSNTARQTARLTKEVRHELATLSYYSVFDWLEFEVRPDSTVILRGEVTRPTIKSDAEANVKDIEGVERVVNQIKVLPLSPNDDRLRLALYRAIYNFDGPLFRYSTGSMQAIHIIVENGRATLKGIVDNEADKNMAYVKASGVPGVFAVTNELQVRKGGNS